VDSIVDNFGLAGKGSARRSISDRYSRFADLETPRPLRRRLGAKESFVTGELEAGLAALHKNPVKSAPFLCNP
jgi:hypothetical protein